MNLKLKEATKVYYCKEQKRSLAGDKVHKDVKVTQHIRQLLNEGALVEVTEEKVSDEVKAQIIAEAKKDEAAKVEAARIANLTPAEKAAETKAKKEAAKKAAELVEKV